MLPPSEAWQHTIAGRVLLLQTLTDRH